MKPTEYQLIGAVSLEDLRPKAATKIALSEILAARIRQHARHARLALKNYERFAAKESE